MADSEIGWLDEATTFSIEDLFVIEQNGTAKKVAGSTMLSRLGTELEAHGGIKIVTSSKSGLVTTVRITTSDGTVFPFTVSDGQKGDKGNTGNTGATGPAGYSPTVAVQTITGGHRVTITDSSGPHAFDVMNGDGAGNIFLAEVDVTTFQELWDAYQAGKVLVCIADQHDGATLPEYAYCCYAPVSNSPSGGDFFFVSRNAIASPSSVSMAFENAFICRYSSTPSWQRATLGESLTSAYFPNGDISWLDKTVVGSSQKHIPSSAAVKASVEDTQDMISDAWSSSKTYAVGDYCIYNNALWRCLVQNSGRAPAEGTYWHGTSVAVETQRITDKLSGYRFERLESISAGSSKSYTFVANTRAVLFLVVSDAIAGEIIFVATNTSGVSSANALSTNQRYTITSSGSTVTIASAARGRTDVIRLELGLV